MKRHDLLPHQMDALRYTRDRNAIALFMEMRCGKTPVAIRWASKFKRVLLVAPQSVLAGVLNWEGELRREQITAIHCLPFIAKSKWGERFFRWEMMKGFMVRKMNPGWFLINFEALLHRPEILRQRWDGIIVDESTRIRNPKAQITKLLVRETGHIPARAVLSGLPNPEDPLDYFMQFVFSHGHFMNYTNYWAFRHKHFHQGWAAWDWQPNKGTREKIRNFVHSNAFIINRAAAGVGGDKVRQMRTVEMNTAQKKALKEMSKEFAYDGIETKWVPVVHSWMQKVAGGFHPTAKKPELLSEAKLELLTELVTGEFRKQSAVVWFRFNHEIEAAYDYLRRHAKKIRVAYLHGEVKDSKKLRPKMQEAFQNNQIQVLLMQVKLGKYGWNLSRSDLAIYYSNSYEFEERSQSEDRIIHIKKKTPVVIMDLVTRGTTDEDVVEALSEKRLTARMFNQRLKAGLFNRVQRLSRGEAA